MRPGRKDEGAFGLVASLVLRCDDCITYHVIRVHECKTTEQEFDEPCHRAGGGGSITIPHLREHTYVTELQQE